MPRQRKRKLRFLPILSAGVLTIFLGALGSGLWDVLFKPGMGKAGRTILTLLTFGSDSLRDQAYQSAALDPTSLSSLVLIMQLANFPMWILILVITEWVGRAYLDRRRPRVDSGTSDEDAKKQRHQYGLFLKNKLRNARMFLIASLVVTQMFLWLSTMVLNQSIRVWRVFHANLTICSPYLKESEILALRAQFAGMKGKIDYGKIDQQFIKVAKENSIKLVDAKLW